MPTLRKKQGDISVDDLETGGGKLLPQQSACPQGQVWDPVRGRCVSMRGVAKQDELPSPLGNRQEPGHQDEFLEDELVIATALAAAARAKADDVQPLIEETLEGDNFDEGAFNEAVGDAERRWQDTFTDVTAIAVAVAVAASLNKGEAQVSRGIIGEAPSRQSVLDGMVKASKFHTNEFFNTQVIPALQRQVSQMLDNTPAMGQPDMSTVRAVLDRRLRSVPYWRVVANAAASRSYHYGLLKAGQFQGFRTYQFIAIIDGVTSQICRDMNGREWHIADAVNLVERAAISEDIEDVKRLMPWQPSLDTTLLSNDDLRARGILVPPLHGNCRSTIIMV